MLVRGSGTSVDGTVEVHVCARGYMRLVGWPASVPWRTVRYGEAQRWRAACLQESAEAGTFQAQRELFRKWDHWRPRARGFKAVTTAESESFQLRRETNVLCLQEQKRIAMDEMKRVYNFF